MYTICFFLIYPSLLIKHTISDMTLMISNQDHMLWSLVMFYCFKLKKNNNSPPLSLESEQHCNTLPGNAMVFLSENPGDMYLALRMCCFCQVSLLGYCVFRYCPGLHCNFWQYFGIVVLPYLCLLFFSCCLQLIQQVLVSKTAIMLCNNLTITTSLLRLSIAKSFVIKHSRTKVSCC